MRLRLFLLLLLGGLYSVPAASLSPGIAFSTTEQTFLGQHPVIRLGIDNQFPPFSFHTPSGDLQGFNVDLVHLLEQKLGVRIDLVAAPWADVLALAMQHQLDGLVNADSNAQRNQKLLFGHPFAHHPMAIYTRKGNTVTEFSALNGKKVAVKSQTALAAYLKVQHPRWILQASSTLKDALLMLERGEVDAVADWYTVLRIEAEQLMLKELVPAKVFLIDESGRSRVAVRNNAPELRTLLDKAIASISYSEKQALFRNWNDVQPSSDSSNILGLTEKELRFKAGHPTLRVGAHHWPPMVHIGADGSLSGIAAEYLKQISIKSGVQFVFEPCLTFADVIAKFKSGQIDMVLTLPYQGQADWILSSESYFTSQQVLVTPRYTAFIDGLTSLDGKPVAVRKYNDAERLLRENYPGIQRITCIEFSDCFELVQSGKAVAVMGALPFVGEALSRSEFRDLKVGGTTEFYSDLYIGISPRFPELRNIVNKALASISPEQRQIIVNRHLTVLYEHQIDWARYWPLAAGIAILFVTALLWIRYQHRMNRKLSEANAQTSVARELAQELELYFQQSNDLLSLTDTEGKFLRVNPQWEKVLGYTIASLEGTSYMDLVHPDDVQATLQRIDELRAKKPVSDFANRYRSAAGEYRWLEWRSVPTSSKRVVGAAHDITELRQAQQERELLYKQIQQTNVELERFSYTVSHDLRSPLATIQGFASSIAADIELQDYAAVQESAQHILRAAQRMNLLMQGLLQMARLGKEVENFCAVDLTQVVWDVREHLHSALRDRNGELSIASDLPTIPGDPLRLHELFQNLCENALKYAHPERPPRIQISASDVNTYWVVHVQDNGVGIPLAKQEAVFEMFTQLDKNSGGIGVGLALVKRIVELHGGAVKIRSSQSLQGSIFDLYFPKEHS